MRMAGGQTAARLYENAPTNRHGLAWLRLTITGVDAEFDDEAVAKDLRVARYLGSAWGSDCLLQSSGTITGVTETSGKSPIDEIDVSTDDNGDNVVAFDGPNATSTAAATTSTTVDPVCFAPVIASVAKTSSAPLAPAVSPKNARAPGRLRRVFTARRRGVAPILRL
jgi:hypothetical protein